MIVFGNPDDGRAIANKAGCTFDAKADVVIAHVVNGFVAGGIIYTGFTKASCVVHFAGLKKNWLCRDLIWVGFDYPFMQLSLERLFGFISENNFRSILVAQHLGFEEVARIPNRHGHGVGDIVVAIEYEKAQPWLKIKPRTLKIGVS